MIGLKRGTVRLYQHEKEWEIEAQNTISRLRKILGNVIKDIQHVGSTSILSIKAKPIIDIAVAVDDFNDILVYEKELKNDGFYLLKLNYCLPVGIFMKVPEIYKRILYILFLQIVWNG